MRTRFGLRSVIACLIVITCFWILGVTSASAKTITLEEAYLLAAQNSPQVRAQHYAVEAAEAQVSEAKYYWAPKFSLSSKFGPMPSTSDAQESQNDIWSHFFEDSWGFTTRNSLEFWLPLFTSLKVYHTHELAKIGLAVEELREENEALNVRYDVARAYYGLQLAIAAEDVIQEAEGYVERIQKEYDRMMEEGSEKVNKTDQYRIDIAVANLYRLKDQIHASRLYAEKALSVHTRLELPIEVVEMDFSDDIPVLRPYEEVLDYARSHRGDLKLLDCARDAAKLQAKIQWLQWWPDLVLAGEATYRFSNAVPKFTHDNDFYISDSYNGYGFALGFVLRWNLDPVSQVFKVRQADARAERMAAQRELAISGIELEVNKQYYDVDAKRHNVEITKNSRRAAKRFLTQELMNYEAGEGDVDKLIAALTTFIEQRSLYLSALHDYRVGLVRLQIAVGATDPAQLLLLAPIGVDE